MRTRQSGSSGLTRADVLAVIVLGVFLLVLVGPLASMPRNQGKRAVCMANLARVGKAMLIYANEYDGVLPRAGGPASIWGGPVLWNATDYHNAYGVTVDGEGGKATISSCFYLLVKYLQVPPRMFVCPADKNTKEFKISDEILGRFPLADAWDFGAHPADNCSYAYHIPFGIYGLTTSRDPNLAVAADRNPWITSPAREAGFFAHFRPNIPPYNATIEQALTGNAISHQGDGQNVLFLDGRVTFEDRSFCGLGKDNIYTRSVLGASGHPVGEQPVYDSHYGARNGKDSLLVHDPGFYTTSRSR